MRDEHTATAAAAASRDGHDHPAISELFEEKKLLSFEWVPRFEPPSQNFAAEQVLHPSVNGPDTGIRGKCWMKDSKTYRQYANDCRRIAATMSAKDKTVLLEMARVWDDRAEEAERTEQRREGVT